MSRAFLQIIRKFVRLKLYALYDMWYNITIQGGSYGQYISLCRSGTYIISFVSQTAVEIYQNIRIRSFYQIYYKRRLYSYSYMVAIFDIFKGYFLRTYINEFYVVSRTEGCAGILLPLKTINEDGCCQKCNGHNIIRKI